MTTISKAVPVTDILPNVLQIAGVACVAVAGFLLALWLGFALLGLTLCVLGWAADSEPG